MTMYEFRILCDEERLDVLHREGVYIGKKTDKSLTTVLYQLHAFYVEITYRKYRYHIHTMRCSESMAILEPYLDQIDAGLVVKWGI
jgi:hypothetical protein